MSPTRLPAERNRNPVPHGAPMNRGLKIQWPGVYQLREPGTTCPETGTRLGPGLQLYYTRSTTGHSNIELTICRPDTTQSCYYLLQNLDTLLTLIILLTCPFKSLTLHPPLASSSTLNPSCVPVWVSLHLLPLRHMVGNTAVDFTVKRGWNPLFTVWHGESEWWF